MFIQQTFLIPHETAFSGDKKKNPNNKTQPLKSKFKFRNLIFLREKKSFVAYFVTESALPHRAP